MSAPAQESPAAVPSGESPWLWGSASDLLLGAGLCFVPVLGLLALAGDAVERAWPTGLMPLAMLALNAPHLGAALLRVYERREDRQRYRYFAVHATLAITVLFGAGIAFAPLGSLLLTLYLTLVPWHFSGQNYGIALVFLRRRGIEPDPHEKRSLYLAFALPYAMTFLGLHGGGVATVAPVDPSGSAYHFLALPLPAVFVEWSLLVVAIAWFAALFDLGAKLAPRVPLRALAPATAVLASQALWFALPLLLCFAPGGREIFGPYSEARHAYTTLWISLAHSAQYLWITSYFAARKSPAEGLSRFALKALLAGSALYGFPIVLLSPSLFGRVPYDAGLLAMLAGALNLHHVLIDGAIWKLRSGPIARILIHGSGESALTNVPPRRALRALVYASGVLGVLLALLGTLEHEFGFARASERADLARLERAAERLRWLAREDPALWSRIGGLRAERGDSPGALAAFERSLALFPTASAWIDSGIARERVGDLSGARSAYARALELAPELPIARRHAQRAARLAQGRGESGSLLAPDAVR
jgi:tetratricopeptide (TPR) repeat protein